MNETNNEGRSDRIRVAVKIVKTALANDGRIRLAFTPDGVTTSEDPDFFKDNEVETILDLFAPRGRPVQLVFGVPPEAVRRVIVGHMDLDFHPAQGGVGITLPGFDADLVTAGEMHTLITARGVELRIEHADIRRKAGDYAHCPFPIRQHVGVLALEFALREAVWLLGIDRWAAAHALGPILIMGFDTNNPHGHRDWPPHVHMHMYLPRQGAPIGHYHISEDCSLTHTIVGYRNDPRPEFTVPAETPFTTTGLGNMPVFTMTITGNGALRIAAPDGGACLIRPNGPGFDRGAVINAPDGSEIKVSVSDDLQAGILTAKIGGRQECYSYDIDTGRLFEGMSRDTQPNVATAMADEAE